LLYVREWPASCALPSRRSGQSIEYEFFILSLSREWFLTVTSCVVMLVSCLLFEKNYKIILINGNRY
jgi:hypothetical protein